MARSSKMKVGNIENVSGEVNIAAGNIVKNINTIHQRALTAAEQATRARKLEGKLLAQGVATLVHSLSAQATEGTQTDTPYKGLLSYGLNEAEIFYGRNEAKKDLLNSLKQGPLTVLHAESGAGKTSLLQAGIAAQLIANGHLAIHLRPHDADPVEYIKRMFLPGLAQAPALAAASLREFLRQVSSVLGPKVNLYLLLDQFEEFFNLLKKEERQPFLKSLADCLNDPSLRVRWVLALRAEALSDLAELEPFGITPFKNMYRLNRLSRLEAREAIIEPAKRYGITFEPALIEHILDTLTTNDEVMPTHLQLVCSALTDDLPEDKTLTLAFYTEQEGGTEGILRDYLKRQLEHFPREEQALAWKVLRALITADRQRTVKTYEEIVHELESSGVSKAQIDTILGRLVERRLLSTQLATTETFELAHDYLVKEIQLDPQERARKAAQELLDQETRSYQRHKTLLTAERLAVIEPYVNELRLSSDAEVLLDESRKAVQTEQRARERRRNITVGLSSAVAIAMTILAIWGLRSSGEATKQAATAQSASTQAIAQQATAQANEEEAKSQETIARARELATQAILQRDKNFLLSLLLGVEAFRTMDLLTTRGTLLNNSMFNPQLIRYLSEYGDRVTSVAFSPDGNTLASGSWDNTIILWDVKTGKPKGEPLRGHNDGVLSVTFSPDGNMLASVSYDNTIFLWDLKTGQPEGEPLQGGGGGEASIAFSPNGNILASTNADNTVILWDVKTHQPIGDPLHGHSDTVTSVAFSPDGSTLASGSYDKTIILWDVKTHQPIGESLQGYSTEVTSVAFSPDGNTLASGSWDTNIILWDVETHQPIGAPLRGHSDGVTNGVFSPDGNILASISADNTIILWDVTTHQPIGEPLHGHNAGVTSVAFSPDGSTLATGSEDQTIILWDLKTGSNLIGEPLQGDAHAVFSLAFSPDGNILASSSENTIALWDVKTYQPIGEPLEGHNTVVMSVAFSPDGNTLVSGSDDSTIILWDIKAQQPIGEPLQGGSAGIASLAFSPDGNVLASGSRDNTIILWDVKTHQPIGEPLQGYGGQITSLAFSPDSRILASGNVDSNIILWDVKTHQPIGDPLQGQGYYVMSIAFSTDGSILAGGHADNTIILWDVKMGKPSGQPLQGHGAGVTSVAFSPDGSTLATSSEDQTIILWDINTHQAIGEPLKGQTGPVLSIAFSPDGSTLASGGDGPTIILWDVNPQSWVEKSCQRAGRNFTRTEWTLYFPDKPYPAKQEDATCPQWPLEQESRAVSSSTP